MTPIKYGEHVDIDPRTINGINWTHSQDEAIKTLAQIDVQNLVNRGFHFTYLLVLATALRKEAEQMQEAMKGGKSAT